MTTPEAPLAIEDLASLMVGEVQRAVQSSELAQARRWTELVATVGESEQAYVAKVVGATPEARAAAAAVRAAATVLPALEVGRRAGRVISLTAEGRDLLLREFAGVTVAQREQTHRSAVADVVRPARGQKRPWSIDRADLLALVEAQLVAEARGAYGLLRASVQRGIPRVEVTAGALDARVTLSVAEDRRAASGVRIMAQVVDVRSPEVAQTSSVVASLRLEFRVGAFPELPAP